MGYSDLLSQFNGYAVAVYPVNSYTGNVCLNGSGARFKECGSRSVSELEEVRTAQRFIELIFVDDRMRVAFREVYVMPSLAVREANKICMYFSRKAWLGYENTAR